jgi:N-carbamoyl-L-amino-acid hydrolase
MLAVVITAAELEQRLAGLDGIGIGPAGVTRLAWSREDAATRDWFEGQAVDLGLRVERDPAGNLWACPATPPPWWAIGSHLDSVRGGGRFDGPLGVACAFQIAAGVDRPLAVISFADEEGARFNTPTFGSKALTGVLDVETVLSRRDEHGVVLAEAMRAAGVDPAGLVDAASWVDKLAGFIEVHIDQSTDVARAGSPAGIVSSLASRMRLEVHLAGRADHAGSTPPEERRDALSAAARLIVGAEELGGSVRVTTSRILVEPNAATTIAADVRMWVDARASRSKALDEWLAGFHSRADEVAARTGVEIDVAVASRSAGQEFSADLRRTLAAAAANVLGGAVPEVVCYAGHDAGVLAARIPAAMVFVRNTTGVSHSPAEMVELEDAAVAARIVALALAG